MNARVENRWYSNISLGDIVMYKLKPTTFYYAPPFYILILCFVAFASVGILTGVSSRAIPLINPRGWLDTFGKTQKLDYIQNCAKLIRQGQDMFPGKPFRLATDMGGVVILPVDWAHDVRNNPHLSLNEAMRADFHAGYPGFEPYTAGFADDGLLLTVTRKYLTKHAEIFNRPLSAETSYVLDEKFGNSPDWRQISLRETLLDIVVQCSACVFLGPEACRNPAWLKIVKSYGVNSVQAAQALRLWPKWLRGVANKFLPTCRQLQLQITEGRDIVNTILEKRRTLLRKGNDPSLEKASNLVDWFEKESAGRPYDLVACQLLLSLAAMHATSDLINEMLISIVRYPELVDEIRSEIIKVIPVHGFTRAGMFNLMLLDSVIKESQRHKSEPVTMNRIATQDIKLPDGSILRKGQRMSVSAEVMFNKDIYTNPTEFDGHRYIRARSKPGEGNLHQLTSSTPTDLSWGLGKHACPGRFFVSNEVKVILVHILMKYDIKSVESYTPQRRSWGISVSSDPESRIMLRRRTPEIDIDSL